LGQQHRRAGLSREADVRASPSWFEHHQQIEEKTMAKSSDVRPKITLACTECKERNYITKKNRRNDPDRLELKKFCPRCHSHTAHRETR